MNPSPLDAGAGAGPDQLLSAMFAGLVLQNTNMALVFLGQAPNPQTGKTGQDLENARYFIDQLEMLEVKTKGNLTKQEESLLKQSLASLRMAFVHAVEHPLAPPGAGPAAPPPDAEPAAPATDEQESPLVDPPPAEAQSPPPAEAESRKKFSKKY